MFVKPSEPFAAGFASSWKACSAVTVSFSNMYDPGTDTFTYSFDWHNDGTYEIVDQSGPAAQHTWPDNGSFAVKGKIKENKMFVGQVLTGSFTPVYPAVAGGARIVYPKPAWQ